MHTQSNTVRSHQQCFINTHQTSTECLRAQGVLRMTDTSRQRVPQARTPSGTVWRYALRDSEGIGSTLTRRIQSKKYSDGSNNNVWCMPQLISWVLHQSARFMNRLVTRRVTRNECRYNFVHLPAHVCVCVFLKSHSICTDTYRYIFICRFMCCYIDIYIYVYLFMYVFTYNVWLQKYTYTHAQVNVRNYNDTRCASRDA